MPAGAPTFGYGDIWAVCTTLAADARSAPFTSADRYLIRHHSTPTFTIHGVSLPTCLLLKPLALYACHYLSRRCCIFCLPCHLYTFSPSERQSTTSPSVAPTCAGPTAPPPTLKRRCLPPPLCPAHITPPSYLSHHLALWTVFHSQDYSLL